MLTYLDRAFRSLLRTPSFSLTVVAVLTLGMASATAIFSIVDAALLRPLGGVADPGRLVLLQRVQDGQVLGNFGYPDYLDYRAQAHTFDGVAATGVAAVTLNLEKSSSTKRIRVSLISGNYFSVLGVRPVLGRLLQPDDERNRSGAMVVSYNLWQRDFIRDPRLVGTTVHLDGRPFTVAGVAAPDFSGTTVGSPVDVWIPVTAQPLLHYMSGDMLANRDAGWLTLFGRLAPGVRMEQAQAEASAIAANLGRVYAATNARRGVMALSGLGMDPDSRQILSRFLGLLLGAVILLLAIAGANAAGLLLARGVSQRRQIAVRMAIGGGMKHIVAQFMAEAFLMAAAATVLALFVASDIGGAIVRWQPGDVGLQNLDVSPDLRVFAFVAAAALLATILSSLAPIWQARRIDLVSGLKDGSRGAVRSSRIQNALVAGQIALSVVLLIPTGLVLRTTYRLRTSDQGFETHRAALFPLDLTASGYSEQRGTALFTELQQRVQSLPGVVAAGFAATVPPDDYIVRGAIFSPGQQPANMEGHEFDPGNLRVDWNLIGPDALQAMGMTLKAGRDFTAHDDTHAPRVALVNERLAQQLWPNANAIGQRIVVPGGADPLVEVIGVVRDANYRSLIEPPAPLLFLPLLQRYGGRMALVVRTAGNPDSTVQPVLGIVHDLDKSITVVNPQTMAEHIAASLWQQQLAAGVIGILGLIAAALASIGLYGIVAHSMAQRTPEIGIRQALGACASDIRRMVLRQGFRTVGAGLLAGIPIALLATRFIQPLLYKIRSYDPWTFAAVCGLLVAVALIASGIPALRAARIDPADAFRYDR